MADKKVMSGGQTGYRDCEWADEHPSRLFFYRAAGYYGLAGIVIAVLARLVG